MNWSPCTIKGNQKLAVSLTSGISIFGGRSLRTVLVCSSMVVAMMGFAQAGPNDPSTLSNNAAIGTNAWSTPTNGMTSNDAYATVSQKGITQYLSATNFEFAVPSPTGISGIRLDVERSTSPTFNVALLNAWSTGLTKTVSAGTNRCLLVTYCQENGLSFRDITAMTYGGRSMTQVGEVTAGVSGGFTARIEVWMLLESELALASSTAIVPTYGPYTALEYCEVFSSAVFQHVGSVGAGIQHADGWCTGRHGSASIGHGLQHLGRKHGRSFGHLR